MCRTLLSVIVAGTLIAAIPLDLVAQDVRDWTIQIRHFENAPGDPDTRIAQRVRDALENEFELQGIRPGASALSRLLLGARSVVVDEAEFIVVALVEGGGLTEPVLDAAADHEIWYADKPKPENLEEGRFVRQMMTRDILDDMMYVHGVRLLFFPVDDLKMEISRYVTDYRDRMSCEDPRDCSAGDADR